MIASIGVLDYNYGKFCLSEILADLEVVVQLCGVENDNSQNQQENQSIDEEDENNLEVDLPKKMSLQTE